MKARGALLLATLLALLGASVPPARADLSPMEHRVGRGENATRIAALHATTLADLRARNPDVDLDRLRAGQVLVVGEGRATDHLVRSGETFASLAERYGVSSRELAAWNPGVRALSAGVTLHLWARRDEPPSESVGRPDRGELIHGIPLPAHPAYELRDPTRAYVTRHVADLLLEAFDRVLASRPDAPRVQIRDASRERGGPLRQHRSHQSGRDVDLVYYQSRCRDHTCRRRWMQPEQLDAALQWALIEPWLRDQSVEYVFVDHALQEPLYDAARESGATRAELSAWFQWPRAAHVRHGVVRHVPRHDEHLHVRFACATNDARCVGSDARD